MLQFNFVIGVAFIGDKGIFTAKKAYIAWHIKEIDQLTTNLEYLLVFVFIKNFITIYQTPYQVDTS